MEFEMALGVIVTRIFVQHWHLILTYPLPSTIQSWDKISQNTLYINSVCQGQKL